ncbi:hypothetical protein ACROYT_G015417 [Oculina patagonica]
MPDNDTDNTSVHKKNTTGNKRKASDGSRAKGSPEHIEEVFKSFKANLEISYDKGQEEDLLHSDHKGKPPGKRKHKDANDNRQKNMDVYVSVGQGEN